MDEEGGRSRVRMREGDTRVRMMRLREGERI
jgi:hypothetical protein